MIEDQKRTNNHDKREVSTTNPIDLLQELFNLLEDYGPLWYTKETRDRVLRILVQSAH